MIFPPIWDLRWFHEFSFSDRFSTDQSHTTLSSRSLYLHPGDLTLDSPSAHQSSGDEFGSFPNAGDHSNSSSQPTSACVPSKPCYFTFLRTSWNCCEPVIFFYSFTRFLLSHVSFNNKCSGDEHLLVTLLF